MKRLSLYLFVLCFGVSCFNAPDLNEIPALEFVGLSKGSMEQSAVGLTDSIFVTFQFEDGDGDIGTDQVLDLTVLDDRTNETYNLFSIPMLPEQGAGNGISGEIRFKIFSTCCIFPNGIPPCESPSMFPDNELSLSIYLVDRAGNQSNTIQTSPIQLLCN